MSLEMTIILLQLSASIFMSFGYFIKPKFLKNCDMTFIKEINKSKKRVVKNKLAAKKHYKQHKFKTNLKISILILLFILLYFSWNDNNVEKILSLVPIQLGIVFIFILFGLIFYFFYLLFKKIEVISIVITQYCFLFLYKCLLLASKKGFIAGSGILLLGLSFLLRILNELDLFNKSTLHLTQTFSIMVIFMSLSVIAIMIDTYSNKYSDIKKSKNQL